MAINEFPIAQILKAASSVEYKQAAGDRLCLDKVTLFFQDTAVTLLPIADTDEIEILCEPSADAPAPAETPLWCQSFLGKKLMTVWVCDNDQGYRDQVIFAFEHLHPSISFIAECSALTVFRSQPISRTISDSHLQPIQV